MLGDSKTSKIGLVCLIVIFCMYVITVIVHGVNQSESQNKIEYALENDYQFYYNGTDVTENVEHMDLDKYSVSFKNWDDNEVLLSDKKEIVNNSHSHWYWFRY